MAHPHDQQILPSLLDRLLDDRPGIDFESTNGYTLQQVFDSVLRDLEELLNTRCTRDYPIHEDLPPERAHLLYYGLPTALPESDETESINNQMVRAVEQQIKWFEPRLREVRVTTLEASDATGDRREDKGIVRLRIEGRLVVDPFDEAVSFATTIERQSHSCQVREKI